jgi:hypothetical protein
MTRRSVWCAAALALVASFAAPFASAANPLVTVPGDYESTAAHRYAALDAQQCVADLRLRQVPFSVAPATPGVDAPVLLHGELHGISFKHLRARDRPEGAVLDCRLLLALDDFSALLAQRDVVEAGFVAAYRHDSTGRTRPGQRHAAALAVDISQFRTRGGTAWIVARDFPANVGAATCGCRAQIPFPTTSAATNLRSTICEAAQARIFNVLLTPNYDRDHHDHVHLEVRRHIRWFLVQ